MSWAALRSALPSNKMIINGSLGDAEEMTRAPLNIILQVEM